MSTANRNENSLEEKKLVSEKLIKQNPNYVPVEIYKSKKSALNCFEKKNFLVPCSFPFFLLVDDIRKKIGDLDKNQALFCFVNQSSMVKSDTTMAELYSKYKNEDGFLYVEFSDVNAYG